MFIFINVLFMLNAIINNINGQHLMPQKYSSSNRAQPVEYNSLYPSQRNQQQPSANLFYFNGLGNKLGRSADPNIPIPPLPQSSPPLTIPAPQLPQIKLPQSQNQSVSEKNQFSSHSQIPNVISTTAIIPTIQKNELTNEKFDLPKSHNGSNGGETTIKYSQLQRMVQQLYMAQGQVQLEAAEIQRAQTIAGEAQQNLEDSANNVRVISAALHASQETVANAALRAQTAQLQLAAHDQLLFTARQKVDALSAQMVALQAEVGINGGDGKMSIDLPALLTRLKEPLKPDDMPKPIPTVAGTIINENNEKTNLNISNNNNSENLQYNSHQMLPHSAIFIPMIDDSNSNRFNNINNYNNNNKRSIESVSSNELTANDLAELLNWVRQTNNNAVSAAVDSSLNPTELQEANKNKEIQAEDGANVANAAVAIVNQQNQQPNYEQYSNNNNNNQKYIDDFISNIRTLNLQSSDKGFVGDGGEESGNDRRIAPAITTNNGKREFLTKTNEEIINDSLRDINERNRRMVPSSENDNEWY